MKDMKSMKKGLKGFYGGKRNEICCVYRVWMIYLFLCDVWSALTFPRY